MGIIIAATMIHTSAISNGDLITISAYTNMALMMVVCVIIGIIFSYITIQTGNCMYAAIMHGVVNVIGELPVYMTHDLESGLLGPNPTGILAISFLAAFSILLLIKMKD